MSDIVERAKAALEGVTEGPWVYVPEVPAWSGRWQVGTQKSGMSVARDLFSTDARFIAAARSLLPELVAEVERLREQLSNRAQWNPEWGSPYDVLGDV